MGSGECHQPLYQECINQFFHPFQTLSPAQVKIWWGKNNFISASKSACINDNLRSEMYSKGIFHKSGGILIRIACGVPRSFGKSRLWQKSWVLCTAESSKQFGKWQPKYGKQWLSYFTWKEKEIYKRNEIYRFTEALCIADPLFHVIGGPVCSAMLMGRLFSSIVKSIYHTDGFWKPGKPSKSSADFRIPVHRITGWLSLEGPLEGIISKPPCSSSIP